MYDGVLTEILGAIIAVLTIILGALGLYTKGQKEKIKRLEQSDIVKDTTIKQLGKAIKVHKKRADLHRDIARITAQNSSSMLDEVSKMQKKVEEAKDGEILNISI